MPKLLKEKCDLYGPCNNPDGCWYCLPKNADDMQRLWLTEKTSEYMDTPLIQAMWDQHVEREKNRVWILHPEDCHTGKLCRCAECRKTIASLLIRLCPRTAPRWFQANPGERIMCFDDYGYEQGLLDPQTLKPVPTNGARNDLRYRELMK